MKEATSELNLTVIVVTIVALLSFFFFSYLWPSIKGNLARSTKCDEAICECPSRDSSTGKCIAPAGGTVTCYYRDKNGTKHNIVCAWKG